MIDASAGRPRGPVALWVSVSFATFGVLLDGYGTITHAPPIVGWSVGQRFTVVHRWARRKDRGARFAWIGADGTLGEVWS